MRARPKQNSIAESATESHATMLIKNYVWGS